MVELNSLFDLSVIAAVFGAMVLYFGKIICDIDVGFHNKLDYSLTGSIYVIIWIIFPFFVAYAIYVNTKSTLTTTNIGSLLNFFVLLISGVLLICSKKHIDLNKKGKTSKDSKDYFIKYAGHDVALFFYAGIAFFITLDNYLFLENDLINFVISIIATFTILTLSSMVSAYRKIVEYPQVKFFLQDGSTVNGTVIKYDDFIKVLDGSKKEVKINKDALLKIEKL